MALNIKNELVEALVHDVVQLSGESKTEAVRVALLERLERLQRRTAGAGPEAFWAHLERNVWPGIAAEVSGHRLTRAEEDELLGYGEGGV